MNTFGEYFKQKRIESRQTLRGFCRKHDLDAGNISRLERGRASAPKDKQTILNYARYLEIPKTEWQTFCDLASISAGLIPPDLTDEEVAKKLPLMFEILRSKISEEELRKLIEMIKSQ